MSCIDEGEDERELVTVSCIDEGDDEREDEWGCIHAAGVTGVVGGGPGSSKLTLRGDLSSSDDWRWAVADSSN